MSEGVKLDFALVNAERLRKEAQPALLNEHRHLHGLAKLGEVDCVELDKIHKLVVDEMTRRGLEHDSPLECKAKPGLKLNEPHAYLVWKGKKRSIALPAEDGKGLDGYLTGTPLVLCQNGAAGAEAYGEVVLGQPAAMTQAQFDLPEYADCHCVRPEERREWWDGVKQFYVYPIKSFARYDKPRPVLLQSGCKCYLPDVRFKQYTPPTAKEQEVLRRSERLPKQIILTPRAVSLTGSMLYGDHDPRDVDMVVVGAEWRSDEGQFVVPLTPTFKEKLERVLRAVYQTGNAVQYISEGEGPTFDHLPLYALALVRLPRLEVEHVSEMEPEMAAVGYDKDGAKYNPGQARDEEGRWASSGGGAGVSFGNMSDAQSWGTESFDDWRKSLKPEEVDALDMYAASKYTLVNATLRGQLEETGPRRDLARSLTARMDTALEKDGLKEDVTVYRRMGKRFSDLDLQPGDVIQDNGFISTSLLQEPLREHFRGSMAKITVPKGIKAAYLGFADERMGVAKEQELLLQRGLKLKVKSYDPNGITELEVMGV